MDLRQALAAKRSNETTFDLPISDTSEAEQALELATRQLRLATLTDEGVADAEAAEQAARASLAACFHRLRFRNLPAHDFEALVGEHEATPDDAEKGEVWNRDSLTPALLAACAVDSDLTTEEWAAELATDRWNAADKLAVYRAALDANIKQRSALLPKG